MIRLSRVKEKNREVLEDIFFFEPEYYKSNIDGNLPIHEMDPHFRK